MQQGSGNSIDYKGYQDLNHLTEAERTALSERMRIASRSAMGPKGERRRDKRWDFSQADIAICVEHPGGGLSRFLVWSRDISAGGMAFIHGGFLHVGSRCRIAPVSLDGHRIAVNGTVTGCRLVEGRLHTISIKFEQRIDPSVFLAEYEETPPTPPVAITAKPPAAEPIYTSLKGKDGDTELVNRYISDVNAAAKKLAESMTANDVSVVKDVCSKIKGSATGSGFDSMGTIAGEVLELLDAGKPITDAMAQLQNLRQLCERAAMRRKKDGGKGEGPAKKNH